MMYSGWPGSTSEPLCFGELTEDEIFAPGLPCVDPLQDDDIFGTSADAKPLTVEEQHRQREILSAIENDLNSAIENDLNSAQGVGVHSEYSVHQGMIFDHHSALLSNVSTHTSIPDPCISFRDLNCSPQGFWPFSNPNPTADSQDFPSMLVHPFDESMLPIMRSRAHVPTPPMQAASHQQVLAPNVTVTRPIQYPTQMMIQEQDLFSMTANLQYGPPMNTANLQYEPPMNRNMEYTQQNFNRSSSGTHGHAQEQMSMAETHGPSLGDMERPIEISYSSHSSGCSIQETNSQRPVTSINQPALFPLRLSGLGFRPTSRVVKKPRLGWTEDLVMRFEAAIGSLGGPGKATPVSVCRIMNCPEVDVLHVKSRLQKYRLQAANPRAITKRRQTGTSHSAEMEKEITRANHTLEDWARRFEEKNVEMMQMLAQHDAQAAMAKQNASFLMALAAQSTGSTSVNIQQMSNH
ncbi:hypothetical protein M758_1G115800 [Ceratodon purpureus]|nr:hypothetical protein M758_1G115800 [Ceratodon purpureus]